MFRDGYAPVRFGGSVAERSCSVVGTGRAKHLGAVRIISKGAGASPNEDIWC